MEVFTIILIIVAVFLAIAAFKFLAGMARTAASFVIFILGIGLLITFLSGNDLFGQKTIGAAIDTAVPNCCAECREAFSKSPVAIGPEGVLCGKFPTAQQMSAECYAYFKINQMTVAECS